MIFNKVCLLCGTPYETDKNGAKYCCEECRTIARKRSRTKCYLKAHPNVKRREKKEKKVEVKVIHERECPMCGKMFTPPRRNTQKYCSEPCAKKAKYRKHTDMIYGTKEERERLKGKRKKPTFDEVFKQAGSSKAYTDKQYKDTIERYSRVDVDSIIAEFSDEKSTDKDYAILMVSLMLKGWGKNV